MTESQPDEVRLRRAGQLLSEFGTLWRNPVVPDRLREELIREIFGRFDVDGAEIIAVHPQPNENAWLLGLVAAQEWRLLTQRVMGLVGARPSPINRLEAAPLERLGSHLDQVAGERLGTPGVVTLPLVDDLVP